MSEKHPLVSVVIVNWNGKHFLVPCLESVFKSDYKKIEVIVVDCASKDGSAEFIRKNYPKVRLIEFKEDPGFDFANDYGIRVAKGRYILMLNNDVVLPPDAISRLVEVLKEDEYSVVLPVECTWKGTLRGKGNYANWIRLPIILSNVVYKFLNKIKLIKHIKSEPLYIGIPCTMLKKDLYMKYPIDIAFGFYEDVEWGLRLKLMGVKFRITEDTCFYHKGGGSSKNSPKEAYFKARSILAAHYIAFGSHTLILLSPLFVYMLIENIIYYLIIGCIGCIKAYFLGILDFIRTLEHWKKRRRTVQATRKIGDGKILRDYLLSRIYVKECRTNVCGKYFKDIDKKFKISSL